MDNAEMKAWRFARWAEYRKRVNWIVAQINAGRTVYLQTSMSTTKLTKKHIGAIKATKTGLYIQHGKRWIDYSFVNHISAK